jgi:hypothetical protein
MDNKTVRVIADEMGLDYENAKLIVRLYKREGRVKQFPKALKKYVP